MDNKTLWEFRTSGNILDRLNVYLVSQDLKPTCMFELSSYTKRFCKKELRILDSKERLFETVDPRIRDSFKDILISRGLVFSEKLSTHKPRCTSHEEETRKPIKESFNYCIGKSPDSLERLASANSDYEKGIAFGFPIEAIKSFNTTIDGEYVNNALFEVNLARAIKAGMEPPLWAAYLSFVPERSDFFGGRVSQGSREIGSRYMQFVRINNPDLAIEVEKHFLMDERPNSWEQEECGKYFIHGDPRKIRFANSEHEALQIIGRSMQNDIN